MIAIGSDHGGVSLKAYIMAYLKEEGIAFKDFGTQPGVPADYPDVAAAVCRAILQGECSCGILVCGTGIGMSMAANKISGIRAAHVTDTYSARMAREHNDAQVLCLGERITGPDLALELVKAYLAAEHLGGRHARRVEKIMALEQRG